MVWGGISSEPLSELVFVANEALNANRYIEEILSDYISTIHFVNYRVKKESLAQENRLVWSVWKNQIMVTYVFIELHFL